MGEIIEVSGVSLEEAARLGLGKPELKQLLRRMIEIRRFEEKVEELFLVKGQLVGPSHLYIGQEAVAAGVVAALEDDDVIFSTYRGHGHALARGVPAKALMAELFGKATGTCRGLGGSMHAAICPERNILFASAIVGSTVPLAAGTALALKHKQRRSLVAVFFGDGALNSGAFHEGANLAAVWRVPLLLVCENNQYAMGTLIAKTTAARRLAARGLAYDLPSYDVDGNDVLSVYAAARRAASFIREGGGPAFLLCRTYRLRGHGVYDKAEYRPPGEAEAWGARDPLKLIRETLLRGSVVSEEEVASMEAEVAASLEEAVKFAVESPPLPFEELEKLVYA